MTDEDYQDNYPQKCPECGMVAAYGHAQWCGRWQAEMEKPTPPLTDRPGVSG